MFRPSDYTAALLWLLRQRVEWVRRARVLDVGCGSGVLLAAAGTLGAAALCGVDIEADAVAASRRLLETLDLEAEVEVHEGDLFGPVRDRRFDLILANLPHFPMQPTTLDRRLASWSSGGGDGRAVLDRFMADIGDHLAPQGRAILAHNAFVDVGATRSAARRQDLRVVVADTLMVPLPPAKLAGMTPAILQRESGRSICRFGTYAFAEVHVLAIDRGSGRDDQR